MYTDIKALCQKLEGNFTDISENRKQLLTNIADITARILKKMNQIDLIYICTHNSRRSHFGQIWGNIAAEFYDLKGVSTFSCGTEATAFHPNAIEALRKQGFIIDLTVDGSNPTFAVHYGENETLTCFSKVFDHPSLPVENFIAIMTCSEAEENCPFVPGTLHRFSTTYDDPKVSDGTDFQDMHYLERANQIATENLYLFKIVQSIITNKL